MQNKELMLSLDSSHFRGSVAVSDSDELLSGVFFNASDTHSATLLPAVDSCLRMAGVELKEIEKFGVVIGPGSFTGLRIGLSTIKSFASVRQRPVYPVSSLELLAAAYPYSARPVAAVIDARRNEVYFGLYSTVSGMPEELIGAVAVPPGELAGLISGKIDSGRVIVCGTGAERYRDLLESDALIFSDVSRIFPSASLMPCFIGRNKPAEFSSLEGMEPLYIRPPDASPSTRLSGKRG